MGMPGNHSNCHVVIIALAADARIRIKARENRIFKHFCFLLHLRDLHKHFMGTRFSIAWYVGIVNDFVKTRIVYLNIVLRLIFRRNILVHTLPNNQGALQLCFYNCLMTAVHAVCQNLNG